VKAGVSNVELELKIYKHSLEQELSQSQDLARFAIMNGLKASIAGCVMQREPNSLADVIKAARIAELTCDNSSDDVSTQIQKLHAKIDRMTAAVYIHSL